MPGYHPPDNHVVGDNPTTAAKEQEDVEGGASAVKVARVEFI